MSVKPPLVKAGDPSVGLGALKHPPRVDIRVVSEEEYQRMMHLINLAKPIVVKMERIGLGNEGIASEIWLKLLEEFES